MELNIKTLSLNNLVKIKRQYGKVRMSATNDTIITIETLNDRLEFVTINELEPVIFSDIDLINIFNPTVVRSDYYTTFCFNDGNNIITINFNHDGHVGNCFIEGKNVNTVVTKCAKTLYIHDIQNIANAIGLDIEDKIFNYYKSKYGTK